MAIVILVGLWAYIQFAPSLRRRARSRAERKAQFGNEYDRFKDDHNNPWIPDFIELHPERGIATIVVLVLLFITAINCVHTVPAGHRGVLLTLGKVTEKSFGEGLQLKLPYIQRMIDMKVMLEMEEISKESAASSDLQEITTTLTVHFNIMPEMAWKVYKEMRQNYHTLLLRPVMQEDLKATTAQFTAEMLIKTREQLVIRLTDELRKSVHDYGIYVQTVNFVDFQFSEAFSTAIESKVTQEQKALEAKNKLLEVQYQAQQKIIQAEAEKNATIITAEAAARQVEIAADAEAYRVEVAANAEAYKRTTEAKGRADAIQLITEQMTPEYAKYLHLMQWDGKYPTTMLGSLEDLGVIIDATP